MMAEVLIDIKVMDLFTQDDYERLRRQIKKQGAYRLYFQGEGVRMVRDKAVSAHVKELHIKRYTSKSLPPYVLLLKDIEYAIESYKSDLQENNNGSRRSGFGAMG